MSKQVTVRTLKSLFAGSVLGQLLKEEDDSAAHEAGESGVSLDAQVDRYLGQYEADAKKADTGEEPSVEQMESLDWRDLVKGRVIIEAGEGDKDEEDDADDEAPGAEEMTGQDSDKLGLEKLDVEHFANDIVRLIENYDSLLEVRNTLLRRARSFLEKNYNDDVLKAFDDTMRDDHGMEAGQDKFGMDADKFPAPAADRASGSAQPGPGGGGAGAP